MQDDKYRWGNRKAFRNNRGQRHWPKDSKRNQECRGVGRFAAMKKINLLKGSVKIK